MSVVIAGGGTAGHIEPALALADAVRRTVPEARITALGTQRGLETTLVPRRGYPLELIPAVPLPRKPSMEVLRLPMRIRAAVRRVRQVLDVVAADVVVGFGGYVALPAYLAWRMMREGLYAIGLEPATNPFGNPSALREQGYRVDLEPGEQRVYTLEFGILDGSDEIERFAARVEALA